jgi:hypothetical protein
MDLISARLHGKICQLLEAGEGRYRALGQVGGQMERQGSKTRGADKYTTECV